MIEQLNTTQVLEKIDISSVGNLPQIETIFPNPQTIIDKLVIETGTNEYYWGELTDPEVLQAWKFQGKIPKRLIFIHNRFLEEDNSSREDTFKGFVVRNNESPKTLSLVGDRHKPFNIELVFEEDYSRYLEKISDYWGVWGNSDKKSPQNLDEVLDQLDPILDTEEEKQLLSDIIKKYCEDEINNPKVMFDMNHRHGLQAMYVMSLLVKDSQDEFIQENKLNFLTAAILHDYMAVVDGSDAHPDGNSLDEILNNFPVLDSGLVKKLIGYTDYKNNTEGLSFQVPGGFQYEESEDKYLKYMQFVDIVGQCGSSRYATDIINQYGGKMPMVFGSVFTTVLKMAGNQLKNNNHILRFIELNRSNS